MLFCSHKHRPVTLAFSLLILICLWAPQSASAAIMTFSDEVSFSAAVTGLPDPISGTEDFTGFGPLPPGGAPAPCDPLSSGCGPVAPGIAFASGGSGLVVIDFNLFDFTEALGTGLLTDSMSITLEGGGTALGFTLINEDLDFGGDDIMLSIELFDADMASLGTVPVTVPYDPFIISGSAFFGVTATGGDFIGGLTITPVGTEAPLIKGVSFNSGLAPATAMPAPSTLVLSLGGLGMAAALQRHRRRRIFAAR